MKDLLALVSRSFYRIPGGYYLYKLFSKLFPIKNYPSVKVITTPFHFKIQADISKYLGNKIYWRGAHDWNSIFALKKFLHPDDIILDIGANIGEYTLYAASLLSENGKVFAFEPVQKMYNILNENVQLNPHLKNKIITIKKGLGKQTETLPIFDEEQTDNEGLFSLHQKNFQKSKKIQDIEIDKLDNIIQQLNIPKINFIKIDVEGNELFVLQGGEKNILQHKPKLMIEISEKNFNAAGYSKTEIFSYLQQLNYNNFYLILARGRLKKINHPSQLPHFCNILALP